MYETLQLKTAFRFYTPFRRHQVSSRTEAAIG